MSVIVITAEAVLIAAFAVWLTVALRAIGRDNREHARERQLLINQILHQAGATWQPPPAAEPEPEPEPELLGEPVFTVSPDQLPEY